ncbi:BQ5605_C034g11309 [Microbotryum silenes-dioicae]|uniref:BQ5605_C034g11309 protein n=1 Tax=Microbotryum silenes-dioicae TaxID=796604 RepID=A0A2X0MKG5_9BASI|nr:BQ5605_C034g11309 [Microbotryum silenes-dioicae]
MRDASLEQRLERSAVDFLGQRDLVEPVLRDLTGRLSSMCGVRLFCTDLPECTVTVHDLRIRVLEPLVMLALQLYHDRKGEDGNKPAGGFFTTALRTPFTPTPS